MARRLLVRGADVVVTMDGARREIAGGDVLVDGGVIAAVGAALPSEGADVIDARGCSPKRGTPSCSSFHVSTAQLLLMK